MRRGDSLPAGQTAPFHLEGRYLIVELAVIIPVLGMSDEMIQARLDVLREKAMPETVFRFYRSQRGPGAIESRYDRQLAGDEVMRLSCQAERDGCGAAIVWCAGDPAVDAARELVEIPIIGTGEAGMLFAYHLARNFCVLTGDEELAATSYDVAVRSGLKERMVSIRGIQMSVDQLRKDREEALRGLERVAREAAERDGAHAFVFGCLALTGMGEELSRRIGLPVVDPAHCAVSLAESLAKMGLTYSRRTYAAPPVVDEKITGPRNAR